METARIAAACISLIGMLLFGLAAAITLRRRKTRTYYGYSSDPRDPLYRLVRAHGNTAEYAGVLCAIIWVTAQVSPSLWTTGMILVVTLSRYCQAFGMLRGATLDAPPNVLRLVGTTGTYCGGLCLCLLALGALL